MKNFLFIISLLISLEGFAQKINFTGFIKEKGTNFPIPHATIKITDKDDNVNYYTSDTKGLIQFKITGDFTIEISCVGFKNLKEKISYTSKKDFYLEEDFLMVDQVVVTGTKNQKTLKDSPVLTQVITSKDIERKSSKDLEDVLTNEIPGLEFSKMGYGSEINIQGLGAKYILFLIDGERVAGETNGNIDYSMINPDNIQRIEFIKGAGATLYGSNAIAGVINIITKQPKSNFNLDINLRYGETSKNDYDSKDYKYVLRNHWKQIYDKFDLPNINSNINLGFKNVKWFSNTNFNYKSADGYIINNTGSTPDLYVDGQLDYKIIQKVGYHNKDLKIIGNFTYYDHDQYVAPERNLNSKTFYDYKYSLSSHYKITNNLNMKLSVSNDKYQKYEWKTIALSESPKVYDYKKNKEYEDNLFTIKYLLNYTYKKHIITAGTEYFQEKLTTDMFENSTSLNSKTFSDPVIYLQDEITIKDNFKLNLGFRYGYHSEYKSHFTPNVSAKYEAGNFNYRFNYARGFKSPSLKELFMDWDHLGMFQIIGSKDLKPETSNHLALSIEHTNSDINLSTSLSASYTDVTDQIGTLSGTRKNPTTGEIQATQSYQNFDHVRNKNIIFMLKKKLFKKFSIKASYSYTHTSNIYSRTPKHSATAQIEYDYSKNNYGLNINLAGKYRGKREYFSGSEDNLKKIEYADISTWRLSINQNFKRKYKLNFGVDNIFNYTPQLYAFETSTSLGRRFFVKLGYKF